MSRTSSEEVGPIIFRTDRDLKAFPELEELELEELELEEVELPYFFWCSAL